MSKKTITKFSAFVISFALVCLTFSGCFSASSTGKQNNRSENALTDYQNPQVVGKIKSGDVIESSGIAVSKCQPDVFWTHNDSDDDAFIYAFNSKGENLGTWRVAGAKNNDWEDISEFKNAAGECFLYIGDIGDNAYKHEEHEIYRVREPQVTGAGKSSTRKNAQNTEPSETIKFNYPDEKYNAETLFVHPQTGDIYILTKRKQNPSGVYKLAANYSSDKTNTVKKIAEITVPSIPNGLLTGGDISPDGRRIIVCDYFDAYEFILPENAKDFNEIWKQKPVIIHLGEREVGEAVGYSADGKSIFATSENENSPLIEVKRK
ncbi:MAG: hypothetical protein WA584_21575 [Pyrinomonadaceae bacterium]